MAQKLQVTPNRYDGRCSVCSVNIPPMMGNLLRFVPDPRGKVYETYCRAHAQEGINAAQRLEMLVEVCTEWDEKNNRWKVDVVQPRPMESEYKEQLEPAPFPKTAPVPESKTEVPVQQVTDAQIEQAVQRIAKMTAEHFLQAVPNMVKEETNKLAARKLEIKVGKTAPVQVETAHKALPDILLAVTAGVSPFLVGPAGSGKTTLAEQVATVLKLQFYMAARVTSEFKLVGFMDAQGRYVSTQFRKAYEHGGIFLFDEVDASDPDALTAFNAALANGLGDFPDGMVKRHKDFHALAAGNTFGRGADRQYVGRNQLDAATLDRFQTFEIDYDEQLEMELAGNLEWTKYVQAVRASIAVEKVRHIVSPRASISGSKLLAAGMDRKQVEEACIWKGLPEDAKRRVLANMGRTF